MSVSSRMLRKFKGDQDALAKAADDISDGDETPFSPAPRANTNINRYNLLNDETQSESEVKEDDDPEFDSQSNRRSGQDSRVSKRKKKKKKRKQAPASQKHSSEDMDEIERSVKEVNAILGLTAAGPAEVKVEADVESALLCIERKHLNPKNELKRMFGFKTIQASETHKGRGRNRFHTNSWLVTLRDGWTHNAVGGPYLTMVPTVKKDGAQYFKYEHNSGYQAAERRFMACVEELDPDELVALSNTYPLHVNTLLQLSEICKMSEENSVAAQMIERALFSLECGFHVLFNIGKGNCRLDYRYQENRALFIAIFKHLLFVGQRACYRTALEFCKLLLSLDPIDDPLAIVLAIDFYAIRAGEYKWLLRLIEETHDRRFLCQLPNMAYSMAVAHFRLEENDRADELLQEALMMFPAFLIPLLEKCSIAPDPKTIGCNLFQDGQIDQPPALKLLISLYIGRSYHIWKDPQILRWLERNTLAVIDRVAKEDPLIAEFAQKRKVRFAAKTPRAVQRHVLLSDITDVNATEVGVTLNFDPLPPYDSINIYERMERPHFDHQFSTFSLFFRSMMPFFNDVPDQGAHAVFDRVAQVNAVAEGDRASLHSSVANLIEAMRSLMANLQPPNDSGNESTDDNASGEEET